MYRIVAIHPDGSETTIYDPVGAGALPVLGPRTTEELNEAGSLEFSLVYGHPAWERLVPNKTYMKADLDGREIFYGRVLTAEPTVLTGQAQYMCSGALSFLKDGEIAPDPKKNDGTTDFQTMTAEAFFRRCIDAYNADIGNDQRRRFTVGTVNHSRKNETKQFQISQYTDVKSILDNQLIGYFGGFLRTRRDGNGALLIDWVEQYGDTDQGVLELGRNVISLLNRMTGEELYTTIRPVGDNNLTLSNGQTIDVYPSAEMAEYGKIVKNVSFPGVTTESELRTKAEALVGKIRKTMVISSEISLVDMIFTDEDVHGVNLGDVYTGITGLEGTPMTVAARNRDFENPQNDSCTLKNPKCFEGNDLNTDASGGISKRSSKNSSALGYSYKYIHEFQDRLEINAKELGIYGEQIEIHAQNFVETAQEFSRIATVEGKLREDTNIIMGTGVFQNSEHITEVAGQFRYNKDTHEVELIDGSELKVHKNGVEITVGTRLTELSEKTATFEGSALWTQRNNITGIVGEFDIVTIDGKRTLRVKSGGGIVIRRNETDFGLWDKGELTGGMMVQMLNDGSVTTQIRGDHIDISTNTAFGTVSQFVADKTPIIDNMYTKVTAFDGSTLWQQRDNITGVVGEFAVVEYLDPLTGKMVKKLVVKSGGGIRIQRNNTEFGLYDEGSLTGGIMVEKLNDNTVTTTIRGDHVDITSNTSFSSVSGTVNDITRSALWQNKNTITGVVGEFEIITDPNTGVKRLVIKSGGGIKIRKNNTEFGLYDEESLTGGIMVDKLNDNTVTTTIRGDHVDITSNTSFSSVSGTVDTITRSALWQDKNTITGVVGEFEIVTDPNTGVKRLVIKSGGGIKIRRNNTEFGLYDEESLTGGIMVDKLNDDTVTTTIRGDHVDITSNSSFSSVSGTVDTITRSALWQDKNTITGVVGEFEVKTVDGKKVLVVKSGGGIKIRKNDTEFGLYDEDSLTAGVVIKKINGNNTSASILASKIYLYGTTKINEVFEAYESGVAIKKVLFITSSSSLQNTSITGDYVLSPRLSVKSGGTLMFNGASGQYYALQYSDIGSMIKSVTKSGSKLTFTMFNNTTLDFSLATTLSGSWSGGIYKVTASTNGSTTVILPISLGVRASGTAQYSNFTIELCEYDNRGNATVRASSRMYLIEHVSGAGSYVDVSNVSTGTSGIVARISTTNTYNAGRRAVSLGTMTWDRNSDNLADNNTIRVSTVGKESESSVAKTMYLNVGGWLWGNAVISVVENTRDGRGVMVSSISIPEVTETVWENTSGRKWRAGVNVGGITRYSEEKDFSDYYYVSKDDIQFYRDRSVSSPDQIPGWGTADAPVQVESNFGLPKNQYGYYYFHITVHGRTKYYWFYYDTR